MTDKPEWLIKVMAVTSVHEAQQGNIEPLLERLRHCDLAPDEKEWIETRLLNPSAAKMKAGAKKDPEKDCRDQQIIRLAAWYYYVTKDRKKTNWHRSIAADTGLSETAVRNALKAKPTAMTKLEVNAIRDQVMCGIEPVKPLHFLKHNSEK